MTLQLDFVGSHLIHMLLLVYDYMCGKREGIQNSSDQNRGEWMWGGMKTNEYFLSTILTKKSCKN